MIHQGDCIEVMAGMDADSIDAIVTDPPYGLEFMGKEWDRLKPDRTRPDATGKSVSPFYRPGWGNDKTRTSTLDSQQWHARWCEAALRVAKPGAYMLAFGGTRTVHRMTCAIEDAGWVIRDVLVWAYAQGFPKSRASLKPSYEPIVLARKPGRSTDLQIDAARIGTGEGGGRDGEASADRRYGADGGFRPLPGVRGGDASGRWPANVVLTDPIFDGGWDGVVGGGEQTGGGNPARRSGLGYGSRAIGGASGKEPFDTSGTYSRFFLVPKASRSDREPQTCGTPGSVLEDRTPAPPAARLNTHPTVKPLDLMRHLARLVTPPGGTVLDPFLGSGTTGIACELEGFEWIGIEREAEYVAIAEARLAWTQRGMGLAS